MANTRRLEEDLASFKKQLAQAKGERDHAKGERDQARGALDRLSTQLFTESENARSALETNAHLEQRLRDEQTARKAAEMARDAVQQQLGGFLDSDSKFLERSLAVQREQSKTVVSERNAESLAEEKRKREDAETAQALAETQLESERIKRRAIEETLRDKEKQARALHAAAQLPVQPQLQPQQHGLPAATCTGVHHAQTTVAAQTAVAADAKLWRFIDAQSQMQGPYDSATMRAWQQQGYFQNHTLVRRDDELGPQGPQWRPLVQFGADPFG